MMTITHIFFSAFFIAPLQISPTVFVKLCFPRNHSLCRYIWALLMRIWILDLSRIAGVHADILRRRNWVQCSMPVRYTIMNRYGTRSFTLLCSS
jgi:hypothetical protein